MKIFNPGDYAYLLESTAKASETIYYSHVKLVCVNIRNTVIGKGSIEYIVNGDFDDFVKPCDLYETEICALIDHKRRIEINLAKIDSIRNLFAADLFQANIDIEKAISQTEKSPN